MNTDSGHGMVTWEHIAWILLLQPYETALEGSRQRRTHVWSLFCLWVLNSMGQYVSLHAIRSQGFMFLRIHSILSNISPSHTNISPRNMFSQTYTTSRNDIVIYFWAQEPQSWSLLKSWKKKSTRHWTHMPGSPPLRFWNCSPYFSENEIKGGGGLPSVDLPIYTEQLWISD